MFAVLLGYALGLLHGVRHALEPDHVAAISTVVAEQRTAGSSMRFAMAWGAGHAFTLLTIGGALFGLRREMPARITDAFELGVALMLIGLGVRALFLARHAGSVAHGPAVSVRLHGGTSPAGGDGCPGAAGGGGVGGDGGDSYSYYVGGGATLTVSGASPQFVFASTAAQGGGGSVAGNLGATGKTN